MSRTNDRIPTEDDLHAYVDGLIDPARLPDVEAWLEANPAEAARLRQYHRLNREIRAGLDRLTAATPPAGAALEQRLYRRLLWRAALRRVGTAIAASLMLAGGWGLRDWAEPRAADLASDGVPLFADEAAEAHHTLAVRSRMAGPVQPVVAPDPALQARQAAALAATAGRLVTLPRAAAGLQYLGSDLVPWDEGTALQIAYRENDGELITLFVVTEEDEVSTTPKAIERDGLRLVYWQSGRVAYTLGGDDTDEDLLRVANQMAETTG
ncbi:anti-sigma factor family protein [Azospirillum sp. ST 5-10]|uniref:anti-sigma factor family protein n=1 Tax=unclassified Azospirillum TaxID=2630922 RepID=UPI003F4A3738